MQERFSIDCGKHCFVSAFGDCFCNHQCILHSLSSYMLNGSDLGMNKMN